MDALRLQIGAGLTLTKADNPRLDEADFQALVSRFEMKNPAYFKALRSGRSVYDIPKTLPMAWDMGDRVVFLRGLLPELQSDPGVSAIRDLTLLFPMSHPHPKMESRAYQDAALADLLSHSQGVLEAPTGSGKTAMAVRLVCARGQQTLILVHTQDLLAQWVHAFKKFCGLRVGVIQGRKEDIRPVTVAMMQSLSPARVGRIKTLFGMVLVDEGHHVPALTLRKIVSRLPARYRYGVTATMDRADELDFLIEATLGPVLHKINAHDLYACGAILRPEIVPVETGFPPAFYEDDFGKMIALLVADNDRNALILSDVFNETRMGHCSLVLSHRIEHARALFDSWQALFGGRAVLATGDCKKVDRTAALSAIRAGKADVLFATRVADEGLDMPRLDRLFLTCPSRHHSKVIQQIGRITRPFPGKGNAVVYDYVDGNLPMARSQYENRDRKIYWLI